MSQHTDTVRQTPKLGQGESDMVRNVRKITLVATLVSAILMMFGISYANSAQLNDDNKKENGTASCTDGIDNDLDGLIDSCDPDCTKNRNVKKILKWTACTSDEAPLSDEDTEALPYGENLLLSSSGDRKFYHDWFLWNGKWIGTAMFGDDPAFYIDWFSTHMTQDVILPSYFAGKYVALAGYVMTDDSHDNEVDRADISAYFMDSPSHIINYAGIGTTESWCGLDCWQPVWGVYQLPDNISQIMFILNLKPLQYSIPATAYFDDLEMRIFDTPEEADAFVYDYIENHPKGIR